MITIQKELLLLITVVLVANVILIYNLVANIIECNKERIGDLKEFNSSNRYAVDEIKRSINKLGEKNV